MPALMDLMRRVTTRKSREGAELREGFKAEIRGAGRLSQAVSGGLRQHHVQRPLG